MEVLAKPQQCRSNKHEIVTRLGEAVAAAMRRHHLTGKHLARYTGKHPETMLRWARGETEMGVGDLHDLAAFFISQGDLILANQIGGILGIERAIRERQARGLRAWREDERLLA